MAISSSQKMYRFYNRSSLRLFDDAAAKYPKVNLD